MGGSVSLLNVPSGMLIEAEYPRHVTSLQSVGSLQNFRQDKHSSFHHTSVSADNKYSKKSSKYSVPPQVVSFLQSIGIHESNPMDESTEEKDKHSDIELRSKQASKVIEHIFDSLGALHHLVKASQDISRDSENDTQSVLEANQEFTGKLLHELLGLYKLCGESIQVVLATNPESAMIEDAFGRTPLHVSVDRDHPRLDTTKQLIETYPEALSKRDKSGRLPLHIAVDRQEVNVEVVKLLLSRDTSAALSKRGVGRLPIHYVIFADKPSYPALDFILSLCPECAQIGDVYGRLPIHYAAAKSGLDKRIIERLIAAFPQSTPLLQ